MRISWKHPTAWWATFLATRTYEEGHYNTGRETFLLPVTWRDGWPVILEQGSRFRRSSTGHRSWRRQSPLSGNFTWRDEFDKAKLDLAWMQLRTPKHPWFDLKHTPGALRHRPLAHALDKKAHSGVPCSPAAAPDFRFEPRCSTSPQAGGTDAGLAAFQNEMHWMFLGMRRDQSRFLARVPREAACGKAAMTVATAKIVASTGDPTTEAHRRRIVPIRFSFESKQTRLEAAARKRRRHRY